MHLMLTLRRLAVALGFVLLFVSAAVAQKSVSSGQPRNPVTYLDSTKEQDGLAGSVRRVRTEFAKVELKDGRIQEGALQLLEVTTYGLDGHRTENVSYPVSSAPVGKEEYRYDEKGNIVEMTLRAKDGSIVSREAYEYEFDRLGNWNKMVTSLVVYEGGELKHEPVEITYRTLTYYFDDAVAGLTDRAIRPTMPAIPPAVTSHLLNTDRVAARPILQNVSASAPQVDFIAAPPEPMPAQVEIKTEPRPTSFTPVESSTTTEEAKPEVTEANTPLEKAPNAESSPSLTRRNAENEAESNATTTAGSHARSKAFVLYQAGMMNMESGDAKGAAVAYLESLKLEPDSALVNLSLGHAYIKLKKPGDAIKAFKRAVDLNPELAEAHYGLGYNYFAQNKFRDAVNAFKRAVKLQPQMAKAYFGLALGYQELGDDPGLMEAYRNLQDLDKALAKKLEQTFPESNLPCRASRQCK